MFNDKNKQNDAFYEGTVEKTTFDENIEEYC